MGARMTSSVTETLAMGVAITVATVVVLRLAAATYFLWKADLAEKEKLQSLLTRELTRVDRSEREAASAYTIRLRTELSDVLAKTIACVEIACLLKDGNEIKSTVQADSNAAHFRARELINALSYDLPLRVSAYNLTLLTSRMMLDSFDKPTCQDDLNKLQSIKKIVFRLLHKRDSNPTAELLTMLEVQNIMGIVEDANDNVQVEGRGTLSQLRTMLRDPEVAHQLRREIETGDSDRFRALN
jgi:hypothetical protein